MPLDVDKVSLLSWPALAALALCEFSRFTDAIERMAPAAGADTIGTAIGCPHPEELRVNRATMGQAPYATYSCGVCGELVTR
jgi:hypothetical protein